ncbi:unnamed protein product [Caenorhabditis nigoni]
MFRHSNPHSRMNPSFPEVIFHWSSSCRTVNQKALWVRYSGSASNSKKLSSTGHHHAKQSTRKLYGSGTVAVPTTARYEIAIEWGVQEIGRGISRIEETSEVLSNQMGKISNERFKVILAEEQEDDEVYIEVCSPPPMPEVYLPIHLALMEKNRKRKEKQPVPMDGFSGFNPSLIGETSAISISPSFPTYSLPMWNYFSALSMGQYVVLLTIYGFGSYMVSDLSAPSITDPD